MLEAVHPQWWSSTVFCCIFFHVNSLWSSVLAFCIHFYNASLSWREQIYNGDGAPADIIWMFSLIPFEELDTNNVQNWKLDIPKTKNHCERWRAEIIQYEVIGVVIYVIFVFGRRENLRIKWAWQIYHPVLLTQPPSLSEVSKCILHNLLICHFSMNYADLNSFCTNRGFRDSVHV